MTPDVTLPNASAEKKGDRFAPATPLAAMLVIPIPKNHRQKRSIWKMFLHDLSYLLPVFGILLGFLLAFGQEPFIGAIIITVCGFILVLRIHVAYENYLERKRIEALQRWYRERYLSHNYRQAKNS
jgi:hypothetical protein